MNECPSPEKISSFLLDELSAAENLTIASHVDECSRCESVMDSLVEDLALGEASDEKAIERDPSRSRHESSSPHDLVGPNLLFGLLALHNSFVSRAQLVAATSDWLEDKTQHLADILIRNQAISGEDRHVINALVNKHLESNGHDIEKSLAGIGSSDVLRTELKRLNDPDVEASLDLVHTLESQRETADVAGSVRRHYSERERFKQVRSHAAGGLGEVFLAVDQQLDRNVALKRIQPRLADNQFARLRFEQEAEVTGKLEHPGIVPVYALGADENGRPFYAMRFIRGQTLKDEIADFHETHGNISWRTGEARLQLHGLIAKLIDVCQTIEYAHHRGVLHRDLKPDNVMLGKFAETLVVDWGLAKKAGAALPSEAPRDPDESIIKPVEGSDSTPTTIGTVVGTLGFMSPEQASGMKNEEIGPPSDIYGLGAILYRILTSRTSQDLSVGKQEVLRRIEAGEIAPPRSHNANIPRPLESICLKAMSTDPDDRYASARAMGEDLESWLAEEKVAAHTESLSERVFRLARRHRGAMMIGLALSAALAASTIAWLAETKRAQAREAEKQTVSVAKESIERWLTGSAEDLKQYPGFDEFRKVLLREAIDKYDNLLATEGVLPDYEIERARTRMRLGELQLELGDAIESKKSFLAAQEILQSRKIRRSKLQPQAEYELTNCSVFLAQIPDGQSDPKASLESAIGQYRTLIAKDPENAKLNHALAAVLTHRARLASDNDEFEEARRYATDASKLFKSLLTSEDTEIRTASVRGLSEAHSLLAQSFFVQVKLDEAETFFRKAIDELKSEDPKARDIVEARADARSDLGQVHRAQGRYGVELSEILDRKADYELLAESFPDSVRYRESAARTAMDHGQLMLVMERYPEAETILESALGDIETLTASNAVNPRLMELMATCRDNLVVSKLNLLRDDDVDEADRTVSAFKVLDARLGGRRLRHGLAMSQSHLAQALSRVDRYMEANTAFFSAARYLEDLVAHADPTSAAMYRADLARVYEHYGTVLHVAGEKGAASETLAASKRLWEQVSDLSPTNHHDFARFLFACVSHDLRDTKLSVEHATAAAKSAPQNPTFVATWGAALFHDGKFERAKLKLEEAAALRETAHPFDQVFLSLLAIENGEKDGEELLEAATSLVEEKCPGDMGLKLLLKAHAAVD